MVQERQKKFYQRRQKKIYIDSKGYTGELEKLRRDDSELILKINLKNALIKKNEAKNLGLFARQISVSDK